MEVLGWLKFMIDLFFYGCIFSFLVTIGFLVSGGEFNIGGQSLSDLNFNKSAYMICILLKVGAYFFSIFHIKNLASSFFRDKIFTILTAKNMKFIGYGFMIYSIADSLGEYLFSVVNNTGDTILSGNFHGFNSGWFQFTLGLLFIFMDRIFRYGGELEQENDLTI